MNENEEKRSKTKIMTGEKGKQNGEEKWRVKKRKKNVEKEKK